MDINSLEIPVHNVQITQLLPSLSAVLGSTRVLGKESSSQT